MKATEAVTALTALAQETRLAVYRRLVRAGPAGLPAGRIAAALALPAPTLSFHLAQLSQAGLITARRAGRSIVYAAHYGTMQRLLSFLTECCCQGECEGTAAPPARAKTRRRA